jgi:hypothetical protein
MSDECIQANGLFIRYGDHTWKENSVDKHWEIQIDPHMSPAEQRMFLLFVRALSDFPMKSRYQAMATRRYACFQAVNFWKQLSPAHQPLAFDRTVLTDIWKQASPVLPECTFGSIVMSFDIAVEIPIGPQQEGQYMLAITMPDSENILVLDVGGYLFDFGYDEMFVCAGTPSFISEQATNHYQNKCHGHTLSILPNKSQ